MKDSGKKKPASMAGVEDQPDRDRIILWGVRDFLGFAWAVFVTYGFYWLGEKLVSLIF
jgi:hypothetical protein